MKYSTILNFFRRIFFYQLLSTTRLSERTNFKLHDLNITFKLKKGKK